MKYWEDEIAMPVIDLEVDSLGVIVIRPSGVQYANQAGGVACLHPHEEGVYAPLPVPEGTYVMIVRHFTAKTKKKEGHLEGITEETADFLDSLFAEEPSLAFLKVDRSRLKSSLEAWVYVDLSEPEGEPELNTIAGFGTCRGVLTWPNSD